MIFCVPFRHPLNPPSPLPMGTLVCLCGIYGCGLGVALDESCKLNKKVRMDSYWNVKRRVTGEIKPLSYADRCAILIIEKGKARNTRPTLE